MTPLVTIGIPVRNGERFLERALNAHLAQTYENIEIVASNNASSDRTADILETYAARDTRVRVIHQSEPLGIIENFISTLDAARGEYFMWAADDDQWAPEFVTSVVSELEAHPDAGTAMTAVELVTEDDEPIQCVRFTGSYHPNTSSYLRMLKGATSFGKLNYYFYALYRTRGLRQAITALVDVPGVDRLFICQLCLAFRFRYVDRPLMRRTIRERPTHLRLPQERFIALKRESLADLRVLRALAWSLLHSPIIPWHRKLLLPYALWRYTRFLLLVRGAAFAKRRVPEWVWQRVRLRAH